MGVPHGYFDVPHVATIARPAHASRINMNVFCSINTKLTDRELFFSNGKQVQAESKVQKEKENREMRE